MQVENISSGTAWKQHTHQLHTCAKHTHKQKEGGNDLHYITKHGITEQEKIRSSLSMSGSSL